MKRQAACPPPLAWIFLGAPCSIFAGRRFRCSAIMVKSAVLPLPISSFKPLDFPCGSACSAIMVETKRKANSEAQVRC
eukprot:SAG22_NODE_1893_length_3367_cov_2.848531_2_plen_78_part_00